jgi:large subunit ribosomal protein L17
MRHRKLGRQFGRNTSHRRAMFRALTANLVLHERIETTDAKAKELRRVAERLITRAVRLGKVAYTPAVDLSDADKARRTAVKRQIGRFLQRFGVKQADGQSEQVDLQEKVLVKLGERYQSRPGGYTRIVKIGRRRGDNAPMSLIELVEAAAPETTPEAGSAGGVAKKPAKKKKAADSSESAASAG